MRHTVTEAYVGPRMSQAVQLRRVQMVMERELTPLQREAFYAYYLQRKNIPQIARERGVNKSTVCRTLQRAERRLRQYLKY